MILRQTPEIDVFHDIDQYEECGVYRYRLASFHMNQRATSHLKVREKRTPGKTCCLVTFWEYTRT